MLLEKQQWTSVIA